MLTMNGNGEHRRGRSAPPAAAIQSGEKDEDLALFHEMKLREKHNFLHPSADDLDATLSSKFGGMGAPVKKPGTDLLTSESDKNDYDWLLTPPGTPLFPSLDQEAAALAVLSPALSNGSYSSAASSSAAKSLKSSTYSPAESAKGTRGNNPSPRRQTSTGTTTPNGISRPTTPNGTSRSRSSPAPPPANSRPSTPTSQGGTRPSTPTSKSSTPNLKLTISQSAKSFSTTSTPTGTTPTPRSSTPTSKPSTPTMRRTASGGRNNITSPSPTRRGGPSPKRSTSASRGNSPSAKRASSVITSIAGMPSDAPPNLRTTMPERSASAGKANGSHSHGNGQDSAQSRRRPRSPSFSSSSSQEQRTSSQTSRGSVVSNYDDGLEVNRPSSIGSGHNSSAGKWHAAGHEELLSGKNFAKRVTRSSSLSSKESSGHGMTPSKKTSDPLKRPVDAYRNSPSSVYRHLHSNSSVSPFYSTRCNSLLLRSGVGMNSSMTTSSNASSEHGTTIIADTEGSEREEDDLLSWDSYGRRASTSPRLQQQADIFVLDKDEEKTFPWQDSILDRANSLEPSSSHSQGSQTTLDAEVTSFYETDGIASLEMLEQLGLMGDNYTMKKSGSLKSRTAEGHRASSTEDIKVSSLCPGEYNHSRASPRKVFQEGGQGSPARNLARQESLEPPRRSREFESKIPSSPARHLANLEKQELSERPRKSRDFESKSSPTRRVFPEGQGGSPARQHLTQLEKPDIYASPRKSRDFEARGSPRGSPSRHSGPLEKPEISAERPRKSQDFETELLKRNGEKPFTLLDLPPVHNSEIRAACLFVRDFKVGTPSPPNNNNNNLDSPLHHTQIPSPGVQNNGSQAMEVKLRKELSHDWDNSTETIDRPMIESHEEMDWRLGDSPVLPPLQKKNNVGSPKVPPALQSLDFPFSPADAAYHTRMRDFSVSPSKLKRLGGIDTKTTDLSLTLHSVKGMSGIAVSDNSSVHNGVMDVTEAKSPVPKEVVMNSPVPPERSPLTAAGVQDPLFSGQGMESDLTSDDGVYAMDEDILEAHAPEDGSTTASGGKEEPVLLEVFLKGLDVHLMEKHSSPMELDDFSITIPESHKGGDSPHDKFLQGGGQEVAAANGETLSSEEDAVSEGLPKVQSSRGEDNEQGVIEEEFDRMLYSEGDNHQRDVIKSPLPQVVPFSVGANRSEVAAEKELFYEVSEREIVENVVHSNGNHLLLPPSSECVGERKSISGHKMEIILGHVTRDHSPQKLRVQKAEKLSAVDVKENSPLNCLHVLSDEIGGNQDSDLPESYNSKSVDDVQKDALISALLLEGVRNPVAELIHVQAPQDIVLRNHQVEESNGLEEELQILKYSNGDSLKEELCHLSDTKEDVPPLHLSEEDIKLFEGVTEFDTPCVENTIMPNYGSADVDSVGSKSDKFIDKHLEVLDLSPYSGDISENTDVGTHSPPRPEVDRALEEQIPGGQIQKIESPVEESRKPFTSSPRESFLVKNKRSLLDPEQDDYSGSMRSSQEEDFIDMLWAEDDSTSCLEGSRERDFLSSRDYSQRGLNGLRSCSRLSDRGVLPTSRLGQSNDPYDAVVRSSRSDLGVEKRIVEVSSKRHSAASPLGQQDDVHMHNREPVKNPLKSPPKRSLLWSKEMNSPSSGNGEDKDSRGGHQSVRRFPSIKARSVRTVSMSPKSRTESPSEDPSSPEGGEVHTPRKATSITVISPESLQWDRNTSAVGTPTKAKTSPESLPGNMTPAEATDTIMFCSSLMHTRVNKVAASAVEKEDPAALASTPTSNGEVPHLSEVNREEKDPEVGESENFKSQGANTPEPPSVRRALSYMGHQTVPLKPADTSLQIPVDQAIKTVKATQSPPRVDQKGQVPPVKVNKARCGCSIM